MLNLFCCCCCLSGWYPDFFPLSIRDHVQHVWLGLQRLLENKLYIKCEFHSPAVRFLGYVVAQWKLQPDPAKIRAGEEWPGPTTRKQLLFYLGLTNFYRRFMRDYSCVTAPLTKPTSISSPSTWSPEVDTAFLRFKTLFTNASQPCRSWHLGLQGRGGLNSVRHRHSKARPLRLLLPPSLSCRAKLWCLE